jgi:hypothetical protein
MTPYPYQEDTRRKAPKQAFLGGGSISLGQDEEDPTVVVMATTVVNEHDGTYEIMSR